MELIHPFNSIISGPSQCGKTTLVLKLIDIIVPKPKKVIWCFGVGQEFFKKYPHFEYVEGGLPSRGWDESKPTLIVIDDLLSHLSKEMQDLFIHGTHHKNASVFFLSQNIFPKNPFFRTMSLNSHYMFLFRNVRDAQQIQILGRQMYPDKPKFLIDAYKQATLQPYHFLFLDFKPTTSENLRIRSNIFPKEKNYAYIPI